MLSGVWNQRQLLFLEKWSEEACSTLFTVQVFDRILQSVTGGACSSGPLAVAYSDFHNVCYFSCV